MGGDGESKGRLAGKVAVVTGAAAQGEGVGNGSAIAQLFAREGARVVLVNRSEARAAALEAAIRAEGGEAAAFAADVTQPDATEAMAAFAVERFGRLDILVNNVGVGAGGNTVTVALEDWRRLIETNLTSAMLCCRACIPRMREGGGGSIVNISSTAGAVGMSGTPGAVAYAASKGGLQAMTLSVAADHAAEGIRANALIVGTVFTPLVARMGEEARERRRKAVPLQTEGTGWDVAYGALYLASDEARWVTGVMLPIDGGFYAVRPWPR